MKNGVGLHTTRGSAISGYIQSNKFSVSVKHKTPNDAGKGFESNQRTDASSKPSREMLEHDRKRKIELKLVVLEDKLFDYGYTEADITERLADARRDLESATAAAVGAEAEQNRC